MHRTLLTMAKRDGYNQHVEDGPTSHPTELSKGFSCFVKHPMCIEVSGVFVCYIPTSFFGERCAPLLKRQSLPAMFQESVQRHAAQPAL